MLLFGGEVEEGGWGGGKGQNIAEKQPGAPWAVQAGWLCSAMVPAPV